MQLTLSTQNPRDSTYSMPDGRILYKVNKFDRRSGIVATISKAVTIPGTGGYGHHGSHNFATPALDSNPGDFITYAEVEFPTVDSARFRYEDRTMSVRDYFRKESRSWFSGTGKDRVFRASDGKEYRWELGLGTDHLDMITNDQTKQHVVRFREFRSGIWPLSKGRPATLEIDSRSGEPILDEIILTFVYCEKLRRDRERKRRSRRSGIAGSGGGGGFGGGGGGGGDGGGGGGC